MTKSTTLKILKKPGRNKSAKPEFSIHKIKEAIQTIVSRKKTSIEEEWIQQEQRQKEKELELDRPIV